MPRTELFRRLRADHRRVIASLDALERSESRLREGVRVAARPRARRVPPAKGLPTAALAALVRRLRRQFATHMAAEDRSLFPSLERALPRFVANLEPLRDEHEELRAMLAGLELLLVERPGAARDEQIMVQWRDFSALLRIHLRKEEALVFSVAERVLPPRELARAESIRLAIPRPARARALPRSGKAVRS